MLKIFKDNIAALVKKGVDEDLIARRSILTPQCGLGAMEAKNADKALDLLSEVSKAMRTQYGVGE